MKTDRNRRYDRGHGAEKLAVLWFTLKCYRILARRYKTTHGEIDLIMRRRNTLVFLEVKARDTIKDGLEAITPKNQQRVANAAKLFLAKHPRHASCDMRFDALVVRPRALPYHVKHAWRL